MNEPIVCGTDLGTSGDFALQLARALALATGRSLHLVHSGQPRPPDIEMMPEEIRPAARTMVDKLQARAADEEQQLREIRDGCTDIGEVHAEFVEGRPWEALVDYAEKHHAKYLVVGPHDHPGHLLGTTAGRILRHAHCSVLVANREPPATFERAHMIVGVDFGEPSIAAVKEAASLARQVGGTLLLVHVLNLHSDIVEGPSATRRLMIDWSERAERALRQLANKVAPHVSVEAFARTGDPASALRQAAHDLSADLVVVGTHGRTGLRRLFLGSVAERCVTHAPLPVLVTR